MSIGLIGVETQELGKGVTQSARIALRTQRRAARPPQWTGPIWDEEEVTDLKIGHYGE